MDNAEAVARLTDVDHSESKDAGAHSTQRKIPLDAQSILDGAYSELVQSGKVEAGTTQWLSHVGRFLFLLFRRPGFQPFVKPTPVTSRRVPHSYFFFMFSFKIILRTNRIKYGLHPFPLQDDRNLEGFESG